MSKLLNIKKWLTIKDASRHLSILIGEEVSEADIFRLALDGNLIMSVHFVNHAKAIKQKIIPIAETPVEISDFRFDTRMSYPWDKENVIIPDGDVVTIDGIFDLPDKGTVRLDLEEHYQRMTGGPEVTLDCIYGTFVQDVNMVYWLLQDSMPSHEIKLPDGTKQIIDESYYPAGGLPSDSVFVVRTSALQSLVASVNEPMAPKPLGSRERKTLLVVIAALAKKAEISLESTGKAAGYIEGLTAEIGARVSKRAIENHLNLIPDALESRMD